MENKENLNNEENTSITDTNLDNDNNSIELIILIQGYLFLILFANISSNVSGKSSSVCGSSKYIFLY